MPERRLRLVSDTAGRCGVSMSRSNDKCGGKRRPATFVAQDPGVDTVRFKFREDPLVWGDFRAKNSVALMARHELRVVTEGRTIGVMPDGMAYVEARLANLLDGQENRELLPPADLAPGETAARGQLADLGVVAESDAGLGRVDLAADVRFEDDRDGRALMRALAHVTLPWCRTTVHDLHGPQLDPTGVTFFRGRQKYARAYDSGALYGTDDPYRKLRLERVIRTRRESEKSVSQFLADDPRKLWLGVLDRYQHLRVLVGPAGDVLASLNAAVGDGRLTQAQADYAFAYAVNYENVDYPDRTAERRRAWLRRAGVALDASLGELEEFPLGEVLHAMAQSWARVA